MKHKKEFLIHTKRLKEQLMKHKWPAEGVHQEVNHGITSGNIIMIIEIC